MKASRKKITLIVEKTKTGFSAYAEVFPIFSTGKTISQLMENCLEASNLFMEEQGIYLTHENLKFEIDFKQFFKFYKVINAKYLAGKIGMNPTLLSQYVQGHKRPSEIQTEKILGGIQQIGKELSEINLIYR